MIKLYIGLHVQYRYYWEILKRRNFSRQFFENFSNTKFHKNPCSWSRAVECGQTDRQDKLVVRFRNIANAPKIFTVNTGCSYVPAVPTYRLFLRTCCPYVLAVPTYRLFLRIGCPYVPAVPTYRLSLRTGCSYVPAVSTYRLSLRTGCSYVPAVPHRYGVHTRWQHRC